MKKFYLEEKTMVWRRHEIEIDKYEVKRMNEYLGEDYNIRELTIDEVESILNGNDILTITSQSKSCVCSHIHSNTSRHIIKNYREWCCFSDSFKMLIKTLL